MSPEYECVLERNPALFGPVSGSLYEHPGQSSVAPSLAAIPLSRAKKVYGSMPRQYIPWEKAFGDAVREAYAG